MRILLLLLFISFNSFSQTYSNYYIRSNSNVNVKADVNVKTESNVKKTITTIDYGALRLANAQAEKNRLESQKYSDEKSKNDAIAIALDPVKAFDLGRDNKYYAGKKEVEQLGFKKFTYYHKIPHTILFNSVGGYNYRNESERGVVTDLEMGYIYNVNEPTLTLQFAELYDIDWQTVRSYFGKTESFIKSFEIKDLKVGELCQLGDDEKYIHNLDINKARIWGQEGFVWTVSYEDDYEYVIKDNFRVFLPNGYYISAGARYRGDKDDIDFEMLEGRREYFKRLVNKHISTVQITDWKEL